LIHPELLAKSAITEGLPINLDSLRENYNGGLCSWSTHQGADFAALTDRFNFAVPKKTSFPDQIVG
jgi:hypothetical protein